MTVLKSLPNTSLSPHGTGCWLLPLTTKGARSPFSCISLTFLKIEHVRYNIVATLNSLSLCLLVSHTHSVLLYLLTGSTKHLPPALDLNAATEIWPLVLSVILGLISVSACSVIASGSASPLGQQWS